MQLKKGSFVPKNHLTIQQLSEEYLNYKKSILSPKTYRTYCQRMILINEHIDYVKVINITAKILDKFYTYLRTEHLSSKGTPYSSTTLQDYYALINNMLEFAVKWDYLNFNPNTKIEKQKKARSNASCYSKEDMIKLLQYLMQKPLKYQAIIITALHLACRRGELTEFT